MQLPELKRVHLLMAARDCLLCEKHGQSLGAHLVHAYLGCGSLLDAKRTFDSLSNQGVSLWTSLVAAYARKGHYMEAIQAFELMKQSSVQTDRVAFVAVLGALRGLGALDMTRTFHSRVVDSGLQADVLVCNALISVYASCSSLKDAWGVFKGMPRKDVVSWTTMLAACAKNGEPSEAQQLFRSMQLQGVRPNRVTFLELLSSSCCTSLAEVAPVHALVLESGLQSAIASALVHSYAKCGDLLTARSLFDGLLRRDTVCWTTMVSAYVEHGNWNEAVQLFKAMQQETGVHLDRAVFLTILNGCSEPSDIRMVHDCAVTSGLDKNLFVSNALINAYGKSGCLAEADGVFGRMEQRDTFSWTSIITAYLQRRRIKRAFHLFREMQLQGFVPNEVTVITLVNAGAVEQAKFLNWYAAERGMVKSNIVVATALVVMHGRLGNLDEAGAVFASIQVKDVVSWTAMVASYAQNGHSALASTTFQRMQQEGVKPGDIGFVSIVAACAHAGLVEQGCSFLTTMVKDYCIAPKEKHFGAAVDLFGRAGLLDDAEYLVDSMKFTPQPPLVWMAFLGACKMHGDTKRRQKAAARILQIDSTTAATMVAQLSSASACGTAEASLRELLAEGCWTASADNEPDVDNEVDVPG